MTGRGHVARTPLRSITAAALMALMTAYPGGGSRGGGGKGGEEAGIGSLEGRGPRHDRNLYSNSGSDSTCKGPESCDALPINGMMTTVPITP